MRLIAAVAATALSLATGSALGAQTRLVEVPARGPAVPQPKPKVRPIPDATRLRAVRIWQAEQKRLRKGAQLRRIAFAGGIGAL